MINSIGQISIVVKDVAAATTFYGEVLGLRKLFEVPGMSFLDCGGVRLMLGGASSPEFDHAPSILYFKVADIESEYQRLLEKGVVFDQIPQLVARMPDHELWMSFFRDSENNTMALMCERPLA